jgi:hypothetical protein
LVSLENRWFREEEKEGPHKNPPKQGLQKKHKSTVGWATTASVGKGRRGAMALLAATRSSWSSSSSPHLCSICVAASVMVSTSIIARGNNKINNNNNSSRNNSSNNSRSSSSSSSSSIVATRKKNLQLQFLRGSSLLVLQFTTRVSANNIAVIDEVGSSKLHKFSSIASFVEDKSCCISLQETRISSSSSSRSNSFCLKQQGSKGRSLRSLGSLRRTRRTRRRIGLPLRVQAFWGRGAEKPTVVEMIPITDEEQFDQLLDSGRPIVVEWFCFLPLFVNFC